MRWTRGALGLAVIGVSGCAGFMGAEKEAAPAREASYQNGYADGTVLRNEESKRDPLAPATGDEADDERLLARIDVDDDAGGNKQQPNQPGGGQGGQGGGQNGQGGGQNGEGGQGGNQPGPGGERQLVPPVPLLIYTAELNLAVYEVVPTQQQVLQVARELGGYLSRQSDLEVVIRVPARRFQDAVERIEKTGQVLHKDIQALDVSEEYRDLGIRLRNAEVVRARLETLLQQAKDVKEALEVQKELGNVTETIETLKGKLRFLQDRIAYSTITVRFAPQAQQTIGAPGVQLPFSWLDDLGLHTLLNMGGSQ